MATLNSNSNINTNTTNQVGVDEIAKPSTLLNQVPTPNSNSPLSMIKPNLQPQLNSVNLSKALTKPPPLSSVLQLPKNALLNSSLQQNGAAKSASSSLSPSPLPVNPSIGSNLIAQSKASAEISASNPSSNINTNSFSPSSSISSSSSLLFQNQLGTANSNTFSNSLPAATTAQLFPQNKQTNQHGLSSLASNSTLPQSTPQLTSLPTQQIQQQFSPNPTAAASSLSQSMNQSNTQSILNKSTTNSSNQSFNSNPQLSQNPTQFQHSQLSSPIQPPTSNGSHLSQLHQQPQTQYSTSQPFQPPFQQATSNFNLNNNNNNYANNQQIVSPPTNTLNQPPTTSYLNQSQQQNQQQKQMQPFPINQNLNSVQQTQNSYNNSYLPNQQGPPMNVNTIATSIPPPISSNTNYQLNANFNNLTRGPPPPTTGPPIIPNVSGPPLGQNFANYNMPQQNNIPPTSQPSMSNGPPTSSNIVNPVNTTINKGPPTQPSMPPTTNQPLSNQFNKMSLNSQPQPPQFQQQQQSSQYQQQQHQQPPSNLNRNQPQAIDLLREKKLILPYSDESEQPIRPIFPHEFYTQVNCHADTIRCTLTSIPETQSLLSKLRLPLGILIHPFKDLESLKVVQSSTIVRCRSCRSYINPFVHFLDNSKWRCNMCYSINDLPDEFLFDPVTRSYGDPSKRPEINSSTIEFIAPPEYTLRPPPSAMYLYLIDVSHNAISTGFLSSFCETLLENIEKIPGDSRTQIGFITYNSSLHFYNLSDSLSQPRMMIYPDLEDLELPMPDSLMVNLNENKESIQSFLQSLPGLFADTYETDSALGTALNSAFLLLKQTGGRITIMQSCLPNVGAGALKKRDENIDKDSNNLAPQTDFYKKLALDCAGAQICVDLFMFNSIYADLATLSCVSKYSGGEIKYYPGFHSEHYPEQVIRFCVDFKRYLTRKIGFESVMRIRCTRGLSIHTFHGNFFVRSTDLLSLPNVNPDAGFGMQVNIEESLNDIPTVCFQAAVLYTSSKSERRIRIHTYCLPVSKSINELVNGADQEAIIGLVAKMAVDRTAMNSLKEAKEALVNVAIDYLQAYAQQIVSAQKQNSLMSPQSLRLIPTYILALIKNTAFKFGNTKMDDRVYAMNLCKTMPLKYLMMTIYPHLYAVHNLDDKKVIVDSSEIEICIPPRLQLSSENIDRHGVYIMDCGESIYMWIGRSVSDQFLQQVFDCKTFSELPDHSNDLPDLENILSERIRNFLVYLYDSRPFGPTFIFFREDSSKSSLFFQHMHDDKTESTISYYEFLRHLNEQIHN